MYLDEYTIRLNEVMIHAGKFATEPFRVVVTPAHADYLYQHFMFENIVGLICSIEDPQDAFRAIRLRRHIYRDSKSKYHTTRD